MLTFPVVSQLSMRNANAQHLLNLLNFCIILSVFAVKTTGAKDCPLQFSPYTKNFDCKKGKFYCSVEFTANGEERECKEVNKGLRRCHTLNKARPPHPKVLLGASNHYNYNLLCFSNEDCDIAKLQKNCTLKHQKKHGKNAAKGRTNTLKPGTSTSTKNPITFTTTTKTPSTAKPTISTTTKLSSTTKELVLFNATEASPSTSEPSASSTDSFTLPSTTSSFSTASVSVTVTNNSSATTEQTTSTTATSSDNTKPSSSTRKKDSHNGDASRSASDAPANDAASTKGDEGGGSIVIYIVAAAVLLILIIIVILFFLYKRYRKVANKEGEETIERKNLQKLQTSLVVLDDKTADSTMSTIPETNKNSKNTATVVKETTVKLPDKLTDASKGEYEALGVYPAPKSIPIV